MDLSAHRFLFVTGKGGVGKTTTSVALAVELARAGRRAVLVGASSNRQLASLAGRDEAPEPIPLAPNLSLCLIDPNVAMREYVEHQLHSAALTRALFAKNVASGFLGGIPGLKQWALLGKAWYLSAPDADGPKIPGAPFDVVIFDAPATGDSTDLLKLPSLISDIVPVGPLARDAGACSVLFRNPALFSTVLVTLPEELPVSETFELAETIGRDLGLPLGPLVVNRLRPPLFSETERRRLLEEPRREEVSDVDRLLSIGRARARTEARQLAALERLRELALPTRHAFERTPAPRRLDDLGRFFAEAE